MEKLPRIKIDEKTFPNGQRPFVTRVVIESKDPQMVDAGFTFLVSLGQEATVISDCSVVPCTASIVRQAEQFDIPMITKMIATVGRLLIL